MAINFPWVNSAEKSYYNKSHINKIYGVLKPKPVLVAAPADSPRGQHGRIVATTEEM